MTKPREVMTGGEVAALFGVDPKTVTRWAKAGLLPSFRTPGGHRRYRRADIEEYLRARESLVYRPDPRVEDAPF